MNYTELKTAIADWAHRSDITDSTLDLFIDLAEAEFNNRLRTVEQETVADLVCTSRYTALPADLAEIRAVEHNGTRLRNLEYATPDYMARWRQYEPSGDPKAYSVRGTDLELIPTPDSVTVTLTYWAKVPALSGANTTNWLIDAHPNMYLLECMRHLSIYIKDDAGAARYATQMQGYFDALRRADNAKRFGGPLRVRVA